MEYKSIVINTRSTIWTNKESGEELLVDADDLSQEIDNQLNKMVKMGYKLETITPINSGNISNASGYLHTGSIILIFSKM